MKGGGQAKIIWDAMQSVARGYAIKVAHMFKTHQKKRIQELEDNIETSEKEATITRENKGGTTS